jgi:hypothetical protein
MEADGVPLVTVTPKVMDGSMKVRSISPVPWVRPAEILNGGNLMVGRFSLSRVPVPPAEQGLVPGPSVLTESSKEPDDDDPLLKF